MRKNPIYKQNIIVSSTRNVEDFSFLETYYDFYSKCPADATLYYDTLGKENPNSEKALSYLKSAFPEKYRDGDDYRHDTAEIINCNTIIILAYLSEFNSVEINEMKEYAKREMRGYHCYVINAKIQNIKKEDEEDPFDCWWRRYLFYFMIIVLCLTMIFMFIAFIYTIFHPNSGSDIYNEMPIHPDI